MEASESSYGGLASWEEGVASVCFKSTQLLRSRIMASARRAAEMGGPQEGGENRHKIQCARLTEIRAQYVEKAKKEIKEKIAELGI